MYRITHLFIAASLVFMASCASSDDGMVSAALTAIDQCNTRCMERPNADAALCAEACAELGGTGCFDDCAKRGGEETECRRACGAERTRGCFDSCYEKVDDMAVCEERCKGAYAGGEGKSCTEGEEVERNGITYVCTDGDWVVQAG